MKIELESRKIFIMKNFIIILILFPVIMFPQDVVFDWTKNFGFTNGTYGKSIISDGSGNIYTTGQFYGTCDFDPGSGIYNLTSQGVPDVFVQKLDQNGNLIWAISLGTIGADLAESLTLDSFGNIYVTGIFTGSLGSGVVSNGSNPDIFIAKIDMNGNIVWVKSVGGTGQEYSYSISCDINDNLLITGYFAGISDFDPGPNIFNLSSVQYQASSSHTRDVFILKLDSNGDFLWAKSIGNAPNTNFFIWDEGQSVTTDHNNNVYVTGTFNGTVDFDPGLGIYNLTSSGTYSIFIQKLDSNGDFYGLNQWVVQTADGNRNLEQVLQLILMEMFILVGILVAVETLILAQIFQFSTNRLHDIFIQKSSSSGI